ncbi:MAG: ATP-binding cassette domain-containing protein [Bacteroidia bacterium]|nr:ATP-binding cassette domain-containing protein [Bacteroidia bacterium]
MTESFAGDVLKFENVHAGYENRPVLQDVNFSIQKGEFVYLVGRTGAGKSSILKLTYADMKPIQGKVQVGDYDIGTIKKKEIPFLRRKLGIVFQDFQLLPDRNVFENIRFALQATGWKDKNKIRNRISEVLVKVGLASREKSMPHQLSGGEQQRISIARALINDPILLLADEPTGNLDPEATEMIMEILFRINLAGTSVLMATHEHGLIDRYTARTLECKEGSIIDHRLDFGTKS